MKINITYLLVISLLMSGGAFAAEPSQGSIPNGIKPGTVIKPTNPITGRVDHSKPYLKADSNGVLRQTNAYGRRLPGPGYKLVGDKIYQTNPITGAIDHSKPQLKIIPPQH